MGVHAPIIIARHAPARTPHQPGRPAARLPATPHLRRDPGADARLPADRPGLGQADVRAGQGRPAGGRDPRGAGCDRHWEVEHGYRIPKERYYLPEVSFTHEEVWAFSLRPTPRARAARRNRPSRSSPPARRPTSCGHGRAGARSRRRHVGAATWVPWPTRSPAGAGDPVQVPAGPGKARRARGGPLLAGVSARPLVSGRTGPGPGRGPSCPAVPPALGGEGGRRLRTAAEGFDAGKLLESGPWGLGEPAVIAPGGVQPQGGLVGGARAPGRAWSGRGANGWVEVDVPASQTDAVRLLGPLLRPRRQGVRRRRPSGTRWSRGWRRWRAGA